MIGIKVGKAKMSTDNLRAILSIFQIEIVDSDGDIEYVKTELGFTWICDCVTWVEHPEADGVCHYWETLKEAKTHSQGVYA